MNDFTILHLSDLHINREDGQLSAMFKYLLYDINNELKDIDNIIVIVTGDIVNKGNYKAKASVLTFFKGLHNILNERCKKIYIVPGNHDKVRSTLDSNLISCLKYDESYDNKWKHILIGFSEYTSLCKDIYSIFYSEGVDERIFEDTFGVHIDVINNKTICFLLFNSAWSCIGDGDEHNIRIGDSQIKKIKKLYEKAKIDKKIDLTIAIAHHPINLLESNDQDELRNQLLSEVGFDANVYICGHTHNRDVINWYNNRHSLTTLMSGIGEPDENGGHPFAHNYASYCFNLDLNSIDIYARSSDDALHFDSDFRIYIQQRNRQENKIVMPIWSGKRQGYFNLNVGGGHSCKACYITDNMLEGFRNYSIAFRNIQSDIQQRMELIKCEFLLYRFDVDYLGTAIQHFYGNDAAARKILFKYMRHNSDIMKLVNDSFTLYLQQICCSFYKGIKKYVKEDIRVHIRKLNIEEDAYYEFCTEGDVLDHKISSIKWGQLIEMAYKSKSALIASANTMWCKGSFESNKSKEKNKKWVDFITIIPKSRGNVFRIYDEKNVKIIKERPYITFGVTVYNENDRSALYMLEYMKIDIVLGELMQDFLYYFPLKIHNWKDEKE